MNQNDIPLNETVKQVTERIIARSQATRRTYLKKIETAKSQTASCSIGLR